MDPLITSMLLTFSSYYQAQYMQIGPLFEQNKKNTKNGVFCDDYLIAMTCIPNFLIGLPKTEIKISRASLLSVAADNTVFAELR